MIYSQYTKAAELLMQARKIAIFTGAGMSTESGISDYRSQGGLWQRYQPVTIQEFLADEEKRRDYWRRKKEVFAQILKAEPNQGHQVIFELQKRGKLFGVITQNIDGLHQKSGIEKVLELHGTNLEAECLGCEKISDFKDVYQRLLNGEEIPLCKDCGGLLKAHTISFGQELNIWTLRKAIDWSKQCDLMLVLGSTLIVEPAASLPRYTKEAGGKLIIVNQEPTPLDQIADVCLRGSIGEIVKDIIR